MGGVVERTPFFPILFQRHVDLPAIRHHLHSLMPSCLLLFIVRPGGVPVMSDSFFKVQTIDVAKHTLGNGPEYISFRRAIAATLHGSTDLPTIPLLSWSADLLGFFVVCRYLSTRIQTWHNLRLPQLYLVILHEPIFTRNL
jgi:hypothetical protein